MRTALALVSLLWIGGAALAQVAPQVAPQAAPPASPKPAADQQTPKAGDPQTTKAPAPQTTKSPPAAGKTGKKAPREKVATKPGKPSTPPDALTSCLELWEPATHMTRGEWGRACRRVAERLKAVTLR